MNEDVLRQFLVSIGFKVDEHSFKKFTGSLENVTKSVVQLGKTVAITAGAVVTGTAVIANQMEKLYYASQRTGATVSSLMALRYAAGQIGLTAEQAQGALENFARTIRLNPGMQGLLKGLGVGGNNPAEQFQGFIGKMKAMRPEIAAMYAAMFGIDPDTLLMLENGLPKLEAEESKYKDRLKSFGLDADKVAENSKDFSNQLRRLYGDFELIALVIESKVTPVLGPLIDRFERWLASHADEIANSVADGIQKIAQWLATVDWDKVGDRFNQIIEALGGFKTIMYGIAAVQLAPLISSLISLTSAVVGLGSAAGGAAGGFGGLLSKAGLLGLAGAGGYAAGTYINDKYVNGTELGDFLGYATTHVMASLGNEDAQKALAAQRASEEKQQTASTLIKRSAKVGSTGGVPRGIRNNNPGNIRYSDFAKSMGATGADADGFAIFPTMESGKNAAMALLQSYKQRGFDTVGKIISRWAPSSENNTAAYIQDIAKKLGVSSDTELSDAQLGGVASAIFGHENGASYAKLGTGGQMAGNQSVVQTNTINVNGASNPQQTASAVGSEMRRVNGDLVRNLSTATL